MWVAVNHGTRHLCDMTNEKCKKGRNAKTLFSLLVHLHKNVNPIPGGTVPNPLQHGFEVAWQFFSSGSHICEGFFHEYPELLSLKGFYRVSANFTAAYVPYEIVSVVHQNERGIGKSIPDARENLEGQGDGFHPLFWCGHYVIINLSTGSGSENPSMWPGKDC